MKEIFLPTRHSFENANSFSGSCGMLRFLLTPKKAPGTEDDKKAPLTIIRAEIWHGLYCYEKSEIEEKTEFPLSDEGLAALHEYLRAHI